MGVPVVIRGYFRLTRRGLRPYVDAVLHIPTLGIYELNVGFLIDTGADGVILGTLETDRLIDDFHANLGTLPLSHSHGVGGQASIRSAQAILTMGEFSTTAEIGILEPPPRGEPVRPIPSLLGRSVISRFGLIVDERTDRILLLDAHEFDALHIPR